MSGAPPNKHINLTVASVTPLASVPSSVHPALGEQQATRRPAAFAADATAGYVQRYPDQPESQTSRYDDRGGGTGSRNEKSHGR